MSNIQVDGVRETAMKLRKVGNETFTRKTLKFVMRKEGKPMMISARRNARGVVNDDGLFSDSIGFINLKKKWEKNTYGVMIGPRVKGKWRAPIKSARKRGKGNNFHSGGWLGAFFELGTKERRTKSGHRTGRIKPDPFMKPAFEQNKTRVTLGLRRQLIKTVDRRVKRLEKMGGINPTRARFGI